MTRHGRLFSGKRRAAGSWRRTRAALAMLGLALCLVAAVDLPWPGASAAQTEFAEPTEMRAVDGVLRATLTAEEREIDLAGRRIKARVFNGAFVGPTLRVSPGDRIELELINHLANPTNLHFHGLHVSPEGEADNIFRTVNPGETAQYVVEIPPDHPSGTFWYHPHQHHFALEQVFGGMSGVIVIDGLQAQLPPDLQGIDEHLFALKDFQVENGAIPVENDPDGATTRTVNGQVKPAVTMVPGETQLWRFANIGAAIFYELHLEGHTFHVIAEDGNPVWNVRSADALVLPPGKRFDVLVQGGEAGTYAFKTVLYDQGRHVYPEVQLSTLAVEGTAQQVASIPAGVAAGGDVDSTLVSTKRDIFFSDDWDLPGPPIYKVNGKLFDPTRVDEQVELGNVEEWTIYNVTPEQHPFHLHVNDFQVVSVNDQPYNAAGLQDVVTIPANGKVVIRAPFMDYPGKFVFHCHILYHEDHAMMAVVEAVE